MAVLEPGRTGKVGCKLPEMPVGGTDLRFMGKVLPAVVVVAAVAVEAAVEATELTPGVFRLKPCVPAAGAPAEVEAPRVSALLPVVAEDAAVAMEVKSVVPALVLAAAGVGTVGCVVPTAVAAAGVAEVKGNVATVVGWVVLPKEPRVKLEDAGCDEPPAVNENPPGVLEGGADVVVAAELNTKPVGAGPWLEVVVLEMALVRVLLLNPKPPEAAVAGVAVAWLKLSFGMLTPKEKPDPPDAGVVEAPKLNPEVWAAGVWVVSENRLEEGVLAAGWEEVPKLNPPVPVVEKEKPVAGVVVAVFEVPNVNPPVEAPAPPKLNPLMASDSGGSSYSGSQSRSVGVCDRVSAPPLPPSPFSRGSRRLSFAQPWSPPLLLWCLSTPH